ncbi:oxygenase MpaB family protein [Halioxenophilus sp. WMMB6]|uniref:oxygenase MpaB family protein n=1 Tax=Halioxenophilus sp. WMMB6 TaxID=3073815 RepID=UPI00295F204C|nr:oxygenase MpaB family protein [Halioxenophilus sp. WMMB6]
MKRRIDIQKEIERLDAKADCQRIVFLTAYLEFPWDVTRALELALFRTFAVPSIATVLNKTGEFTQATQRRYDDTAIIINEILINGYDSERGQAFIQRMNGIHGHYKIKNEDFLYTLSTFIFVPIYWLDRFGWRKLLKQERLALHYFWVEVGKRMGIENIPETLEAFEAWSQEYEQAMYANSEAGVQIGNATRDLLLSFYLPKFLWRAAEPVVYALMDERLLKAMNYPLPSPATRRWVQGLLKARAKILRWLPKHKSPQLTTLWRSATHPDGYAIEDIGPNSLREKLSR